MAYNPTNPPRNILQLGLAHSLGVLATTAFLYESADSHAVVATPGYFTNGGRIGMRVSDIVLVRNTVTGVMTVHSVTAVAPAPAGSSDKTPGGATICGAGSIENTVANGLVATGNNQATALALAADVNQFATVAAGTGAILQAMNPTDAATIFNGGANALALYPPVGVAINGLAVNAPYNIAVATPTCYVTCITPTLLIASQSA